MLAVWQPPSGGERPTFYRVGGSATHCDTSGQCGLLGLPDQSVTARTPVYTWLTGLQAQVGDTVRADIDVAACNATGCGPGVSQRADLRIVERAAGDRHTFALTWGSQPAVPSQSIPRGHTRGFRRGCQAGDRATYGNLRPMTFVQEGQELYFFAVIAYTQTEREPLGSNITLDTGPRTDACINRAPTGTALPDLAYSDYQGQRLYYHNSYDPSEPNLPAGVTPEANARIAEQFRQTVPDGTTMPLVLEYVRPARPRNVAGDLSQLTNEPPYEVAWPITWDVPNYEPIRSPVTRFRSTPGCAAWRASARR